MSSKDHWDVIHAAEKRGWRIVEGRRRHVVLVHPSGVKVYTSATPHDPNSHRRLAADIRKVETRGYVREPVKR